MGINPSDDLKNRIGTSINQSSLHNLEATYEPLCLRIISNISFPAL